MNLTQLKRRELDNFLVMINVIKMEVKIEYNERVCIKNLYTFIGVNIYGKKIYLTYGINYNEDTEFWLQKFKELKRRGVDDVLYIVTPDIELSTRAAQITFSGIKVLETQFELIERISKYFPDNYSNKIPSDINNLYLCLDKETYKENLKFFYENYEDVKIIKLLLKDRLNDIGKYYDISYNIRELLFPYYSTRDYKKRLLTANNKEKIITDLDNFYNKFLDMIINQEKIMCLNKSKWLEIINEIRDLEVVKRYL